MENVDGREVHCGVCDSTDVSVDLTHHHTWQYGTDEDAVELHATIPVWQCNNPDCVYQEKGGPEERGFSWLDWEAEDIMTAVVMPIYRRELMKRGQRWEDWDLEMGRPKEKVKE